MTMLMPWTPLSTAWRASSALQRIWAMTLLVRPRPAMTAQSARERGLAAGEVTSM